MTSMCTSTPRGSRLQCQSCVADSECMQTGGTFRCIPMNYQTAPRGGYCMRAANTGGPPGCTRPYLTPILAASLSGVSMTTYCGIDQDLTTCDAVRALLDGRQCPTGSATECMAEGARCETVGLAPNECTYSCGIPNDCPPGGSAGSCAAGYCGS
jgi:hypothetical protein